MAISCRSEAILHLIKAFGLPKHCTRFVITAEVNDAVRVECEFYPDENASETLTKHYKLVEDEEVGIPGGPPNDLIVGDKLMPKGGVA